MTLWQLVLTDQLVPCQGSPGRGLAAPGQVPYMQTKRSLVCMQGTCPPGPSGLALAFGQGPAGELRIVGRTASPRR
eukprot:NODE_2685_length_1061_cov_15.876482_g2238_i0.p6 GENE.NODE_2685_length_1061_cov_15.876482_g2238_i0~~NODE_2685_length_1061_cov_15.876482_g2238_i0.p6  ORF type:complete len:76 (+),score=7.42 NODE_2685_length_1061_cov_15.876482_g2238_i0:725-952(+)